MWPHKCGGGEKNKLKKNICAAAQNDLQVCVWSRQEGRGSNMWRRRFSLASASWPKFWLSHRCFFFFFLLSLCWQLVLVAQTGTCFNSKPVPTSASSLLSPLRLHSHQFSVTRGICHYSSTWLFAEWEDEIFAVNGVQSVYWCNNKFENTNAQHCGCVMWNTSDTLALSRSTPTKTLWEF